MIHLDQLRIVGICLNILGLFVVGFCDMKRTNIYPMVTAFLFGICNIWLFAGPHLTRLFSR